MTLANCVLLLESNIKMTPILRSLNRWNEKYIYLMLTWAESEIRIKDFLYLHKNRAQYGHTTVSPHKRIFNTEYVTHFPRTQGTWTTTNKIHKCPIVRSEFTKRLKRFQYISTMECCMLQIFVYRIRLKSGRFSIMMKIYTCALQVTWLCQKCFVGSGSFRFRGNLIRFRIVAAFRIDARGKKRRCLGNYFCVKLLQWTTFFL